MSQLSRSQTLLFNGYGWPVSFVLTGHIEDLIDVELFQSIRGLFQDQRRSTDSVVREDDGAICATELRGLQDRGSVVDRLTIVCQRLWIEVAAIVVVGNPSRR